MMPLEDDNDPARMQRDPTVFDTPASKRAREQVLVPRPEREHPYEWLKGVWWTTNGEVEEYWYYSNDRTQNQAKAYIYWDWKLEMWLGRVRGVEDRKDEFETLNIAQIFMAYKVEGDIAVTIERGL